MGANPILQAPHCEAFDHDHKQLAGVLERYARNGGVDYTALQANHQALNRYLDSLNICPRLYEGFSKAQKMAYWINAYNAFTLRLILDNYPLTSIRSLGENANTAWKKRFIPISVAGEAPISLDLIEHGILRTRFNDPRIHFALVCASKGCPRLPKTPYIASSLDAQLEASAQAFINDETQNRLDHATKTLRLSSIFRWYADDFSPAGGVLPYVARYLSRRDGVSLPEILTWRTTYLDYDWTLNDANETQPQR